LRTVAAWALGLGAISALAVLGISGPRPDLVAAALELSVGGVAAALLVIALGGIAASIGAAVPGRERVARLGALALLVGLLLAAATAGWGLASTGVALHQGTGLACLATALLAGVFPSLPLVAFLARALPRRPELALAAAAAGAVALGGLSVQATCTATGGLHVFLGHALAPVLGGLLLAAALYPIFRRLRGRSEPSARPRPSDSAGRPESGIE
jgi:hypothetical protein